MAQPPGIETFASPMRATNGATTQKLARRRSPAHSIYRLSVLPELKPSGSCVGVKLPPDIDGRGPQSMLTRS